MLVLMEMLLYVEHILICNYHFKCRLSEIFCTKIYINLIDREYTISVSSNVLTISHFIIFLYIMHLPIYNYKPTKFQLYIIQIFLNNHLFL